MLFSLLDEKKFDTYKVLIPEPLRDYLSFNYEIAVGAYFEDDKEETPCGLVLMNLRNDPYVTVDWIQVLPEYRDFETGTQLLEQAFTLAKKMNRKVRVKIPEAGERPESDDRSSFFLQRGFTDSESDRYEWFFPTSAIKDIKLPATHPSDNIRSFSQCTNGVKNTVISKLSEQGSNLPMDPACIDDDLSFVYLEGGQPTGYLVIEKLGKMYSPLALQAPAGTPRVALDLISAATAEGQKKADEESFAYITIESGKKAEAIKRVLTAIPPIESKVFTAESDGFDAAGQAVSNMIALDEAAIKEELNFPKKFKMVEWEYYGGEIERLKDDGTTEFIEE